MTRYSRSTCALFCAHSWSLVHSLSPQTWKLGQPSQIYPGCLFLVPRKHGYSPILTMTISTIVGGNQLILTKYPLKWTVISRKVMVLSILIHGVKWTHWFLRDDFLAAGKKMPKSKTEITQLSYNEHPNFTRTGRIRRKRSRSNCSFPWPKISRRQKYRLLLSINIMFL